MKLSEYNARDECLIEFEDVRNQTNRAHAPQEINFSCFAL